MQVRCLSPAPSFVRVLAREVTLSRFVRTTETVKGCGFDARLIAWVGSVYMVAYHLDRSQVTYRVLSGFITRVNGSYNDGGTTLTNSIWKVVQPGMLALFWTQVEPKGQGFDYAILPPSFELDDKMSPLFASALFLEHDTPVAVQGSLNSLIRDKPMSP